MKIAGKRTGWYLWALLAVIAVLLAVGIAPLFNESKALKPSGDYQGMTTREALFAECAARGITLNETEEEAVLRASEDAKAQYAMLGESYTLEELAEEERELRLFDKLCRELPLQASVSEEEIREWYDVRLEALRASFEKNPGVFKSQQDLYDKHGGVEPLVVPEGYVYVRHILTDSEETAKEVLAKLDQGEKFEDLLKAYGTDPGMLEEPYATLGYLVGPYESTVDYYEEFKGAALTLREVGDYSGIVRTPAGYEIIQLARRLEAREKSLEEVRDQISTLLLNYKKSNALTALLRDWTA